MRRVPIRVKLAAALAVPLIAMGLVTVIEVASVAEEASDVRAQTDLATATIGPKGLITALQNERNFVSANLVGVDESLEMVVAGYEETRADTDDASVEFVNGLGSAAQRAYSPALDGLAEVERQLTVLGEVSRIDERDVRVVGDEVVGERVDHEHDGRSRKHEPARTNEPHGRKP